MNSVRANEWICNHILVCLNVLYLPRKSPIFSIAAQSYKSMEYADKLIQLDLALTPVGYASTHRAELYGLISPCNVT